MIKLNERTSDEFNTNFSQICTLLLSVGLRCEKTLTIDDTCLINQEMTISFSNKNCIFSFKNTDELKNFFNDNFDIINKLLFLGGSGWKIKNIKDCSLNNGQCKITFYSKFYKTCDYENDTYNPIKESTESKLDKQLNNDLTIEKENSQIVTKFLQKYKNNFNNLF